MEKIVTLLLVDDNTQLRNLIRMTFKQQPNIHILEASDGVDRLKLFHAHQPNIYLML